MFRRQQEALDQEAAAAAAAEQQQALHHQALALVDTEISVPYPLPQGLPFSWSSLAIESQCVELQNEKQQQQQQQHDDNRIMDDSVNGIGVEHQGPLTVSSRQPPDGGGGSAVTTEVSEVATPQAAANPHLVLSSAGDRTATRSDAGYKGEQDKANAASQRVGVESPFSRVLPRRSPQSSSPPSAARRRPLTPVRAATPPRLQLDRLLPARSAVVDRSISSAQQQQNSSNAVAQHQELKDDVVAMLSNENMGWMEGDGTPLPQSPQQTSVAEIVAAAVADAVHSENLTVDPELVAVAVVAALTVSTTRTLSSVFLWADSFSLCRLCFCLCSLFTSA